MSLWENVAGGYTLFKSLHTGAKTHSLSLPVQLYAEIALDLNVREIAERLFTYEIPAHMRSQVFIGSQVLVPFGARDLVSGFVVSIGERRQGGAREDPPLEKMRPIAEVIETEPFFDSQYIEFLYYVSEYYFCSIGDVLSAAIPQGISAKIKRTVRLVETAGEDRQTNILDQLSRSPAQKDPESVIRSILEKSGKSLVLKTLKDRCALPAAVFYTALSRLKRSGILQVTAQAQESAAPKLVNHIIWTGKTGGTARQEEIINCLKRHNGSLAQQELLSESRASFSTIKRMVNEGILSVTQVDTIRNPLKNLDLQNNARPELTDDQAQVLFVLQDELKKCFDRKENRLSSVQEPWLLHGVTGSGKTEIYLRLIEETLSCQKAALLLVPEISLTPQLSQRLVGRFGEKVGIWHSALSPGERFDTFRRIQAGELQVILGARSAILSNIPQLGLIILDEEHDGSYKQSTPSPRYSAKHLACQRGWRQGAFVLFGSATPDTSTYFQAQKAGRILRLPRRVFEQALAESFFVDMRNEFARGLKTSISETLQQELTDCLSRNEQAILLINRRGYASHVFCRACGHVLRCKHCSVSLVFHSPAEKMLDQEKQNLAGGKLSCHHCGYSQSAGEICPACSGPFLRQAGLGTQKVEEETRAMLPQARILRLDSDITAHKGACESVFNKFARHQADILIGTQIVAKGLDIERVTLVGVLSADAAFNLPDFRSLERGFQLLTQVSGRAGRGRSPGKVILQTFNTDLPALLMAKNQDYETFVQAELASRRTFAYPPFSRLVRILASGPDDSLVQSTLERLAEELANQLEELEGITILGPAPCLIEKIKGLYRHHIIVKNLMGDVGHKAIAAFFRKKASSAGIRLSVDVDPVDLI